MFMKGSKVLSELQLLVNVDLLFTEDYGRLSKCGSKSKV